jgi:hypothetical protein
MYAATGTVIHWKHLLVLERGDFCTWRSSLVTEMITCYRSAITFEKTMAVKILWNLSL